MYFWRFGLKFGGTGKPVHFRLVRIKGEYTASSKHRLSRSNSTKLTRQLLTKHGFKGEEFTEKSMKVGGVTGLCDSGEPLENVQVLGGWKSLNTPMYYKNSSAAFKLAVASRIPYDNGM